jgi:hypothetical protein
MIRPILKHWQVDTPVDCKRLLRLTDKDTLPIMLGLKPLSQPRYERLFKIVQLATVMQEGPNEMWFAYLNEVGDGAAEDDDNLLAMERVSGQPVKTLRGWMGFTDKRINPSRRSLIYLAASAYPPSSDDEWDAAFAEFMNCCNRVHLSKKTISHLLGVTQQTVQNYVDVRYRPVEGSRQHMMLAMERMSEHIGGLHTERGKLESAVGPRTAGRPKKKKSNGVADAVLNGYRKFGSSDGR